MRAVINEAVSILSIQETPPLRIPFAMYRTLFAEMQRREEERVITGGEEREKEGAERKTASWLDSSWLAARESAAAAALLSLSLS